ncbi:hypothetical protein NB693_20785 [Pantoea ananatis]|uniref:hypothetical protein n=1 Tax=Pantoea ananas TaxID=553 RepID=UPI00221E41D8|nr:hypothetical protein [Pantoea ananatis]
MPRISSEKNSPCRSGSTTPMVWVRRLLRLRAACAPCRGRGQLQFDAQFGGQAASLKQAAHSLGRAPVLACCRSTIVRFAPPVSMRQTVEEGLPPERTVRKLQRVLRTHFRRIREAVIGPDLSTRRLLVDQVLAAEPVREAIAAQAKRDNSKPVDAWRKAHAYAWEIAADYSSPVVRSASFLLTHVWNRIYAGVLVHHLDKLKDAARTK